MKVSRLRGLGAAAEARGHVVVIDVLRAFTTAACAISVGARRIVLVADADEALRLRTTLDRAVVVGEHEGRKIAGFDYGNSPAEILAQDLTGRTVILRSSSGTQGVVQASDATEILLGSLVVAHATELYLREHAHECTLLAMGSPFGGDGDEDDACADLLETRLRGERIDRATVLDRVRSSDAGQLALDPAADWIAPEDLAIACQLDRFDFALPVRRAGNLLVTEGWWPGA